MKKNFLRVKQVVDQKLLGAEKTDDLDQEELKVGDQRFEYLKKSIVEICKKLPNAGSNSENGDKRPHRMRKYPEYVLGEKLQEAGQGQGVCHLFAKVAEDVGDAQHKLADEYAEYEEKVTEMVLQPLQEICSVDIAAVASKRRTLGKHILDMDALRNRHKNGTVRDSTHEEDDTDSKVEQSRDMLAIDMFTFLQRENEMAQRLLQLLKLQRAYHDSALKDLEPKIHELEKMIGNSEYRRIYGVELDEHLRVRKLELAYPLQLCASIIRTSLSEDGLFRVSANNRKVSRLKLSIDAGCFRTVIPDYDVHVFASALKLYLRELPEPLLTYTLYDKWIEVAELPSDKKLPFVKELLNRMPPANRTNLGYLMHFLAQVVANEDNRMNVSNISIVMAHSLLWSHDERTSLNNVARANLVPEVLISNVRELFPDDYSSLVLKEVTNIVQQYTTSQQSTLFAISDDTINNRYHSMSASTASAQFTVSQQSENADTVNSLHGNHLGITDSPKPHGRRKLKSAPMPPPVPTTTVNTADLTTKPTTMNVISSGTGTIGRSHNKHVVENNNLSTDAIWVKQKPAANSTDNAAKSELKVDDDQSCNSSTSGSCEAISIPRAAPRPSLLDSSAKELCQKPPHRPPQPILCGSDSSSATSPTVEIRSSAKPSIPERPASLRGAIVTAGGRTFGQHSAGSGGSQDELNRTAAAQKASARWAGHDVQLTEKERFLTTSATVTGVAVDGESPVATPAPAPRTSLDAVSSNALPNGNVIATTGGGSVTRSGSSVNSHPPPAMGSAPHSSSFVTRGHARTRSDGTLVDALGASAANSNLRTPPSPRLAKPSEPPPPPPVVVIKADSANA